MQCSQHAVAAEETAYCDIDYADVLSDMKSWASTQEGVYCMMELLIFFIPRQEAAMLSGDLGTGQPHLPSNLPQQLDATGWQKMLLPELMGLKPVYFILK